MNINVVIDHYLSLFLDKSRCYCHQKQQFNFTDQHLELFQQNDNDSDQRPEVQFLLAYYYKDSIINDSEKAKMYANRAIQNGYGFAHNIIGCIEHKIEPFIKALECGVIRAYGNLGLEYYNNNDHENSKKYLTMGIDQGIICCQHLYTHLYCKDDIDQLYDIAKKGCRTVLDLLYERAVDPKIKCELIEIGVQYQYTDYIIELIDYCETNNHYRFLHCLQQYEDFNDGDIQFTIGKKYISMDQIEKGQKCILKAIELGCYETIRYLGDNILFHDYDAPMLRNIIKILAKRPKLTHHDQLNLIVSYNGTGQKDKVKEIIDQMVDPYYQSIGESIYYTDDPVKSLECLLKAKSFEPMTETLDLNYNIAFIYHKLNNIEQFIHFCEMGINAKTMCYKCATLLCEYYHDQGQYIKSCQYMIDLIKNDIMIPIMNDMITHHAEIEIGRKLIENGIGLGVLCLLNCQTETSHIIDICQHEFKFKFATKGQCGICYETTDLLTIQCGHSLCIDCLNHDHNTCPYCRTIVRGFLKSKVGGSTPHIPPTSNVG